MKKKILSLVLVSAMALSMAACGSSSSSKSSGSKDSTSAESTAATTTNTDTDALYINLASEPQTIDPALNSTVDGGCLAVNSFAGLYTYDKDGNLTPAVAEDMPEVSDDGTEYTIKLKKTKWSDGSDLTANDFIYSWNRVIDPKTAADYSYLFDIIARNDDDTLKAEATDDYTIKITLTNPCPYFNDLLAFPTFYPVPQDEVEAANTSGDNPGAWCQEAGFKSNGAYTLTEWKHNESMVYTKNDNFYDADNVNIKELHFMLSADNTATYAAYNSGDLDFIDSVPTDEIQSVMDSDEFHIVDNLGTYYLAFNVNDSFFDQFSEQGAEDFRNAISLLIDRQYIVDTVGQTGQVVADTFVPEGMSDGNGGNFKDNATPWYDTSKLPDIDDAVALLKSSGCTVTDNGDGTYTTTDPSGEAIEIPYIINDDSGHQKVAESIQQDLATVGITIDIQTEDWNVFVQDRKDGKFTLAREGWLADYNDPINMLEIFESSSGNNDAQLGKDMDKHASAPQNWADYDSLIKQIRTDTDFADRVDLMHQAEDMLKDTGAVIPIYYYNDIYMQKSNVDGIYSTVYGMKYFLYATKS